MGSPATSVKGLHGSETKDKDSLLGFMLQTGEVVPSRIVNEKPHPLERKEWKDKKNKTATETLGQK